MMFGCGPSWFPGLETSGFIVPAPMSLSVAGRCGHFLVAPTLDLEQTHQPELEDSEHLGPIP